MIYAKYIYLKIYIFKIALSYENYEFIDNNIKFEIKIWNKKNKTIDQWF